MREQVTIEELAAITACRCLSDASPNPGSGARARGKAAAVRPSGGLLVLAENGEVGASTTCESARCAR